MANRIVGNVYILDTGSANTALPWNSGTHIQSVAFWSTDTTGRMVLSGADTTNHVVVLENPNDDETTVGIYLGGVPFSEMKLPTLTAGTGWIYLI